MLQNSRRRSPFTLVLTAIFCGKAMASCELPQRWPISCTEFFLVSWMPELREFEPPRGSSETDLWAIAQLVHHGRIGEAERRLQHMRTQATQATQANDLMRQSLCDLWQKEIADRRTRWVGAGWSIDDAAAREKANVNLAHHFEAITRAPTPVSFDLLAAQRFAISGTTPNLESHYAGLRNNRAQVFAESRKLLSDEQLESLSSKPRLEIFEPNVQEDVARAFLDPVTGELYLRMVSALPTQMGPRCAKTSARAPNLQCSGGAPLSRAALMPRARGAWACLRVSSSRRAPRIRRSPERLYKIPSRRCRSPC